MSRYRRSSLLVAAALALALRAPLAADEEPPRGGGVVMEPEQAAPTDIPFNDPGHIQYFKYQEYLAKLSEANKVKLDFQTKATWEKLRPEERVKKVLEGEAFLKKRFDELMRATWMMDEDQALLKAVWSEEVYEAVRTAQVARKTRDDAQISAATKKVGEILGKAGGMKVDLDGGFDGSKAVRGWDATEPPFAVRKDHEPGEKDLLAVKPPEDFLASLNAPEVKKVLESKDSFKRFLSHHNVFDEPTVKALMGMYTVLSQAQDPEKAEVAHLLPTVVRFLSDGKQIVQGLPPEQSPGALAVAVPGKYDNPERVVMTPYIRDTDPIVTGSVLAHEFQHVYDQYAGRYYTLDSELRGFKTGALYLRTLKKIAPKKYDELLNSDSDHTRSLMRDEDEISAAFDEKNPAGFSKKISLGHGYTQWVEGVVMGRMELRKALDPNFGAPSDLEDAKGVRDEARSRVEKLEKRQKELTAQRATQPSRENDKEFEKVSQDLAEARHMFLAWDEQVSIKEVRVSRMKQELAWMLKRSQAKGEKDPPAFDLSLPVDESYFKDEKKK